MNKLISINLPIIFLLAVTIDVWAQIHDFDSLASKDESLRRFQAPFMIPWICLTVMSRLL